MKTIFVLLSILFFSACTKSDNKVNADCDAQMSIKFQSQITCTEIPTSGPCSYLAKGNYKGKKIYFINTVCETCNVAPPSEGYYCDGEKTAIEDFNQNVTNVGAVSPARND